MSLHETIQFLVHKLCERASLNFYSLSERKSCLNWKGTIDRTPIMANIFRHFVATNAVSRLSSSLNFKDPPSRGEASPSPLSGPKRIMLRVLGVHWLCTLLITSFMLRQLIERLSIYLEGVLLLDSPPSPESWVLSADSNSLCSRLLGCLSLINRN